jgi:steroid delta-isomerase-like uncharacterized protein
VINGRDVEAIDSLLSPDFVHNGESRGRDGQKAGVRAFLDGFADLHDEIELLVAEGEWVAAHQSWTGTHSGPFLGVEATGKRVSFPSTALLRIADGMIAEAIDVVGIAELMAQLRPPAES